MLALPDPDLRALAIGETIVAFVPRASVSAGDEVELTSSGPGQADHLKPAYRRWAQAGPPEGRWRAEVQEVHPASALDPQAGSARHTLDEAAVPAGDLLVLRVHGPEGPALSDTAFAARLRSLGQALG
ncbi:MAG: hypothetical protein M3N51_06135 [Actinomycetota bacterium]|nr:hypothetical protein [Actinomycetota bacterium]